VANPVDPGWIAVPPEAQGVRFCPDFLALSRDWNNRVGAPLVVARRRLEKVEFPVLRLILWRLENYINQPRQYFHPAALALLKKHPMHKRILK